MSSFLSQEEIEKLVGRLDINVTEEVQADKHEHEKVTGDELEFSREVDRVEFPEFSPKPATTKEREVTFFQSIPVTLDLELGAATLTVKDVLSLQKGSVVKLDKLAGENASLLVNEEHLATGEVVVINDSFGLRVAEFGDKTENQDEKG